MKEITRVLPPKTVPICTRIIVTEKYVHQYPVLVTGVPSYWKQIGENVRLRNKLVWDILTAEVIQESELGKFNHKQEYGLLLESFRYPVGTLNQWEKYVSALRCLKSSIDASPPAAVVITPLNAVYLAKQLPVRLSTHIFRRAKISVSIEDGTIRLHYSIGRHSGLLLPLFAHNFGASFLLIPDNYSSGGYSLLVFLKRIRLTDSSIWGVLVGKYRVSAGSATPQAIELVERTISEFLPVGNVQSDIICCEPVPVVTLDFEMKEEAYVDLSFIYGDLSVEVSPDESENSCRVVRSDSDSRALVFVKRDIGREKELARLLQEVCKGCVKRVSRGRFKIHMRDSYNQSVDFFIEFYRGLLGTGFLIRVLNQRKDAICLYKRLPDKYCKRAKGDQPLLLESRKLQGNVVEVYGIKL